MITDEEIVKLGFKKHQSATYRSRTYFHKDKRDIRIINQQLFLGGYGGRCYRINIKDIKHLKSVLKILA